MRFRLLVVSSCLLLAPVQAGTPEVSQKPKAPPETALATPDYLSPLARGLLRKRMERHGRDQSLLLSAVTLLQRDVVKSLATDIANEPRLVRPLPEGRDDLNAALPMRFFTYQDELRVRAKDLAAAASSKDDVGLAHSFGQLVEVCVSCHSAFLNDAPK